MQPRHAVRSPQSAVRSPQSAVRSRGCVAFRLATATAALAALLWLAPLAMATPLPPPGCTKTYFLPAGVPDAYAAPIRFNHVNLTNPHLQPPGSLLASTVVPPTDYAYPGVSAASVLWRCEARLLPKLRFLVATNGDSRFGGHHDIGGPDGLTDVYATWFNHVGLKLTMDGVVLRRRWQAVPLTRYHRHTITELGKTREVIDIRLQDIPALHAELYRVSTVTPEEGRFQACGSVSGGNPTATGLGYLCAEPNAYIQLAGYEGATLLPEHDQEGDDSDTAYNFWYTGNGFGYRMYLASTLTTRSSCTVRNATPHVTFPAVSVAQLLAGHEVSMPFEVNLECHDAVKTNSKTRPVFIGIQVSPGAWRAAQALGLVNNAGGVSALVSDQTGLDAGLAQGVGVSLSNPDTGAQMNFAGHSNALPTTARPSEAGWYPVLEGSTKTGPSSTSSYSYYQRRYSATLHALPGHAVTAGRIHATAYVVVKVQ